MSVSVTSLLFPSTRRLAFSGGGLMFKGVSVLDRTHEDNFTTTYKAALWTERVGNANATLVAGSGENPLRIDATPSAGPVSFYLDGDVAMAGPVSINCGYRLDDLGNTLSDSNTVFSVGSVSGGSESLVVSVIRNDTTGTQTLNVVYRDNTMGAPETVSIPWVGNSGSFRLCFANDRFALWNNATYKVLHEFDFVLSWGPVFDMGIEAPATSDDFSVRFTKFAQIPVITGLWDSRGTRTPYIVGVGLDWIRASCRPGYPGEFTLTIHGVGSDTGTSEAAAQTVEVQDFSFAENETRLMTSNIEELYDSFGGVTACRDFAIPSEDNLKDMIVPMQCFADGSTQDATAVTVKTKRGGGHSQSKTNRFGFTIEDEAGDEWGGTTRFDRLLLSHTGHDMSMGLGAKQLRCVHMSNGDRAYYGVLGEAPVSDSMHIAFTGFSGDWELVRMSPDGIEIAVDSGTTPTLTHTSVPTEDGHYILRTVAGDTLNATVFVGVDNTGPQLISCDLVPELHFTWKAHKRGTLVVLHHDVSENTVTKYTDVESNVSLETNSLSAFEQDDNLILVYSKAATDGWEENWSRQLHYKILDMALGTYSTEAHVELPVDIETDIWFQSVESEESYNIHAFDIVKTDDTYNILFSIRLHAFAIKGRDYYGSPVDIVVDRSTLLSDGVYAVTLDQGLFDFGGTNLLLQDADVGLIQCKSIKNLFEYRVPDYSSSTYSIARAEIDFIKAEYCPERDLVVLSVVDFYRRCPLILAGRDDIWSEIAVPFFFNTMQYLQADEDHEDFSYLGVTSCHAVWGHDGAIWAVATRDGATDKDTELMILSPEMFFDAREVHVERGPEFANVSDTTIKSWDIYTPKYRQQPMPFYCSYGVGAGPAVASIQRVNNYLVLGMGGEFTQPVVVQSCEFDQYPLAVSEESVWLPEQGNLGTDYWSDLSSGATFAGSYVSLEENLPRRTVGTTLTTLNTSAKVLYPQELAGHIGYKFHARCKFGVGADADNLDTLSSKASSFEVNCVYAYMLNGSEESERFKATARFSELGGDLLCEVYNPTTALWETVHTFEGYVDEPEIVDYFILIRIEPSGVLPLLPDTTTVMPGGKVMFCYKRRMESIVDVDTNEFYEDYRAVSGQFITGIRTEVTLDTSEMLVHGTTEQGGVSTNNMALVYQMGWNILDIQDQALFYNPKGSTSIFYPDGFPGSAYVNMSDSWLLSRDPERGPGAAFKPSSEGNINTVTAKYHWPNGFLFQFSGESAALNDEWELSRAVLLNTSWLMSKRMHGVWFTQNDDSDVYIWADAHDSGFDKFIANTFMVLGYNAKSVVLVGRDDELDSWTEIETLDLTRYRVDGVTFTEAGDYKVASVAAANFLKGTVSPSNPLYWSSDGVIDAKVNSMDEGKVYLTSSVARTEETAEVFGKRGVKFLEDTVRYRYLGIKVPARETYEGHFLMHTFDFGYASPVPLEYNHALNSGVTLLVQGENVMLYDETGFQHFLASDHREYTLEYRIADRITYAKILSALDKVTQNRRPIWIVKEDQNDPSTVDLCLASDVAQHGLIVDESDDEYYKITLKARSVK